MNICISKDLEDIEDLTLPDSVDAHQNRKYVLPRTFRHKMSTQQQAFADSVIPGIFSIFVLSLFRRKSAVLYFRVTRRSVLWLYYYDDVNCT